MKSKNFILIYCDGMICTRKLSDIVHNISFDELMDMAEQIEEHTEHTFLEEFAIMIILTINSFIDTYSDSI